MATRIAHAVWEGDLEKGRGTVRLGTNGLTASYSFKSRFTDDKPGTNPEELVAGAHAGCFSMALAKGLKDAGYAPGRIDTTAKVYLVKTEDGYEIPEIQLETEADIPEIDSETFQEVAEGAKDNCIISKLLRTADIRLSAKLLSRAKA